ncbi:MAG: succinate dehydrogenase, hydrophobic membrane anchor protein [Parahaliea sp.]
MVTAITSFGRSGTSDWLVQRVGGVILLAYLLFLGGNLVCGAGADYASWKALFDQTWVKIFSMLALLSLATHAWIGMWAVFTDYLTERLMGKTGNVLRITLEIVVILTIFVYVVWGIQILWGN